MSNDSRVLIRQIIFDVGDGEVGPFVLKMARKSTFEHPTWGADRRDTAKSDLNDEERAGVDTGIVCKERLGEDLGTSWENGGLIRKVESLML